jgi:very-short-patch-repair endonuclease
MLTIKYNNRVQTPEAHALTEALKKHGVIVYTELYDGHKHIDITIPRAKINIEVDGIQHLTNPNQILADFSRGYYSNKKGFHTLHIPNEMIRLHLPEISKGLAEASKMLEKKIHVYLN